MFTLTISLFGILPILPVVHQLVRPGQWSAEQVENKQTHTWASGYERHTGTLQAAICRRFFFFAHANFTVFYFMCRWAIFAIVLILMKILHLVPGAGRAPACLPASSTPRGTRNVLKIQPLWPDSLGMKHEHENLAAASMMTRPTKKIVSRGESLRRHGESSILVWSKTFSFHCDHWVRSFGRSALKSVSNFFWSAQKDEANLPYALRSPFYYHFDHTQGPFQDKHEERSDNLTISLSSPKEIWQAWKDPPKKCEVDMLEKRQGVRLFWLEGDILISFWPFAAVLSKMDWRLKISPCAFTWRHEICSPFYDIYLSWGDPQKKNILWAIYEKHRKSAILLKWVIVISRGPLKTVKKKKIPKASRT